MTKKKKCKGCKNKPMEDLANEEIKDESLNKYGKFLLVVYTILCLYGFVRLILDLNILIKTIF